MDAVLGTQIVVAVAAVGSVVVSVLTLWANQRQGHALEKVVESMARVSKSYEKELQALRADVDRLRGGSVAESVEMRKLAQREREAEWKRTRDIMKGIRWFLRNVEVD